MQAVLQLVRGAQENGPRGGRRERWSLARWARRSTVSASDRERTGSLSQVAGARRERRLSTVRGTFAGYPGADARKAALEVALETYKQDLQHPWWIITSSCGWKTYWDVLVLAMVLYTCFYLPWQMAFAMQAGLANRVVDGLVDVCFLADVALAFCTSFMLPTGEEIVNPASIRQNYLRGWFVVDALAAIPFELIRLFTKTKAVAALNLLKAPRLLRLGNINKALDRFNSANQFRILKLLVGFFVIGHWTACGWFYLGRFQEYGNEWTGNNWLVRSGLCQSMLANGEPYRVHGTIHCVPRSHPDLLDVGHRHWYGERHEAVTGGPDLNGHSDLLDYGRSDADFRTQYWTSLYWALTTLTTIGYGDITPSTNGEKIYSMLVMVIGAVIYATIFGNVAIIIQSFDQEQGRLRVRTETVKELAKYYNLTPSTVCKLHCYNDVQKEPSGDFKDILTDLPSSVCAEVVTCMHEEIMARMQSMSPGVFLRDDFLIALLMRMQPKMILEGDAIKLANTAEARDIYIVRNGFMELQVCRSSKYGAGFAGTGGLQVVGHGDGRAAAREAEPPVLRKRSRQSLTEGESAIALSAGEYFCGFYKALELDKDSQFDMIAQARVPCDILHIRAVDLLDIEREFKVDLVKLRQYFFMRVRVLVKASLAAHDLPIMDPTTNTLVALDGSNPRPPGRAPAGKPGDPGKVRKPSLASTTISCHDSCTSTADSSALEDLESAQVKVLAKVDVLEAKLDAMLGALAAGGQGGLGPHPVQGDGAVWAHKKI